ncbi:MAG: hypothetical protein DIU79_14065 [Actinobacteria bacterium]|nr:MAG: hypothetical protein DIU79_14065 [Actinomycetota bacterium]
MRLLPLPGRHEALDAPLHVFGAPALHTEQFAHGAARQASLLLGRSGVVERPGVLLQTVLQGIFVSAAPHRALKLLGRRKEALQFLTLDLEPL